MVTRKVGDEDAIAPKRESEIECGGKDSRTGRGEAIAGTLLASCCDD